MRHTAFITTTRTITANCLLLVLLVGNSSADELERFFETKIRPVLVSRCFKCHGSEKVSNELRVDSREALLRGGDSGAAFIPGKPGTSLLMKAISGADDDLKMPPENPLSKNVVNDFRKWILDGAKWPKHISKTDPNFEAQLHWAFQEVSRPELPAVKNVDWVDSPIDRFVLARLETAKLSPSVRANRRTLIRRLKLDLLGLPPSFAEVEQFVNDVSPTAYERLVDRYLASPHYGERYGRHWLDIARYSDTRGYIFTAERKYPFAYKYRDWVIQRLNDDLPYDQFIQRQIAADLLVKQKSVAATEHAAMGFLTLGRRFLNNIHDIIDDRIDVVTRGTMALTVTCARCHDHKYDPIPAADYYSLYGVFRSSKEPPKFDGAMVLFDSDRPFNPYVFLRGQAGNRGSKVPRQFLKVISKPDRKPFKHGSGRLEMAQQITDPANPLTARVIVNRLWKHHFHVPLVRTPSDFGLRCDPPSHPQLLDWLAAELVDAGWSLKAVHRQIVLSATYQQSSNDDPNRRALDPTNELLWRMNRGRLELEPMRDSILSVTGGINPKLGGESVDIAADSSIRRRTVYSFIDRQNLPALFRTFDFAGPDTHSPARFETTVPQQTLYLRNSPFLLEQARRAVAVSLQEGTDQSDKSHIDGLFRQILGREPSSFELRQSLAFVEQTRAQTSDDRIVWRYGYGKYDSSSGKLASFKPMTHFVGNVWQTGPKVPDPKHGWVSIRANGGHPGNTDHAGVIRWTVPDTMTIRVMGLLNNPTPEGDGVTAIVSTQRLGEVGKWKSNNKIQATTSEPIQITKGETVDLIIHCGANESHDTYNWNPVIVRTGSDRKSWNSVNEFAGPRSAGLDHWGMLAQVLLLSNEFQFAD
jgi:hypothetical protein